MRILFVVCILGFHLNGPVLLHEGSRTSYGAISRSRPFGEGAQTIGQDSGKIFVFGAARHLVCREIV